MPKRWKLKPIKGCFVIIKGLRPHIAATQYIPMYLQSGLKLAYICMYVVHTKLVYTYVPI